MSHITRKEFELLKLCWEKKDCTVRDIYNECRLTGDRKYETIKTTMERMTEKGLLARRKIGPVWLYTPHLKMFDYLRGEMNNTIAYYFNGSVTKLVEFIVESDRVSRDELREIQKMIEDKLK